MTVPNDGAGARVERGRHRVTHAEIDIIDGEAGVGGVALLNEVLEELCGIGVGHECLNLEDDLDDAVEDGESEIELREAGEGDTVPL